MELFAGSVFYDSRWLFIQKDFSIKTYTVLQYLIIIMNILQVSFLFYDRSLNDKHYPESSEEFYFLIISIILISLTTILIAKSYRLYYKEFAFFHEAKKYDNDIDIKPFLPMMRKRSCENIYGVLYIIFAFYKTVLTIQSSFIESFDDKFRLECFSESVSKVDNIEYNNNRSIPSNLCQEIGFYIPYEHISYLLFEFYQKITYYLYIYQILVIVYYFALKGTFALICVFNDQLAIKLLSIKGGSNKELDNNCQKTRGKCVQKIRLIMNTPRGKKEIKKEEQCIPLSINEFSDLLMKKEQ